MYKATSAGNCDFHLLFIYLVMLWLKNLNGSQLREYVSSAAALPNSID